MNHDPNTSQANSRGISKEPEGLTLKERQDARDLLQELRPEVDKWARSAYIAALVPIRATSESSRKLLEALRPNNIDGVLLRSTQHGWVYCLTFKNPPAGQSLFEGSSPMSRDGCLRQACHFLAAIRVTEEMRVGAYVPPPASLFLLHGNYLEIPHSALDWVATLVGPSSEDRLDEFFTAFRDDICGGVFDNETLGKLTNGQSGRLMAAAAHAVLRGHRSWPFRGPSAALH